VLRLLVNRPCDRPHQPTPCSFTNPSSRLRRTFRCLCTLTLCALLPLREPSPRNPPTSDIPCRLQAPSFGTIRRELVAHVVFTSVPDLRRRSCDRRLIRRMLAHPPEAPNPSPFERRFRRRPTWPEPLLRHPSEGMTQPRLGTSSTVSTDCLLSPAIRNAVNSDLNTSALRTPLRRGLWPWAASTRFATEAFD